MSHLTTKRSCLSGVYVDMYIYLITNRINGKRYIGRTERRDPKRRWNEHRSVARKHVIPPCIVDRAIRKYGEDNFTYEIIEQVEQVDMLPAREAYYISLYDTLDPKGYNLETYQPRKILAESAKAALTARLQGVRMGPNKTSKYVGVHWDGSLYLAKLSKSNRKYQYRFKTEREAVEAYDRLALFLYGITAKVNLITSRLATTQELQATYDLFVAPKTTSQFKGVCYISTIQRWRGDVQIPNRSRLTLNEIEAAQFVDVVNVLYNNVDSAQLNFPDRYEHYKSLTVEWLSKKTPFQGSGVSKDHGRYRARIGDGGSINIGYYKTREEAEAAVLIKRKELGMIWDL